MNIKIQPVSYFILFLSILVNQVFNQCEHYENNIYQVTAQLTNYKPHYIILTLLSAGIFNEENNIANGQSTGEIGYHFEFGTRTGYYECLNSTTVHLIGFGYIFKNNELSELQDNGALILQDYYLYFTNNYTKCIGQLKTDLFRTGSDPFDASNTPTFTFPTQDLTCEVLSGRHYIWPLDQ